MHGSDLRSMGPGQSPARLIVLELNELCPTLLDKWMGAGLLPNFRRLHAESDVFVTDTDVTDPALLEPWIQWYSIHTGSHRLHSGKRSILEILPTQLEMLGVAPPPGAVAAISLRPALAA